MGLVYKKILTGDAILGLWKISESVNQLNAIANLSPSDREILSKKNKERRQKEWLAARCLVKEIIPSPSELFYNEHGKPILQSGDFAISISHSEKYAAVLLTKSNRAGVDVQKIKADIGKGIDYFLNNQEQLWVDKADFILLNILWSCKESVFKYVSSHELDIRNQIFCGAFQPQPQGQIEVNVRDRHQETLLIHYEIFEDYVLTRTL
jgi:4'-phosphopantetheinyl transferase